MTIDKAAELVLSTVVSDSDVKRATKYISDKLVVRATRRLYKKYPNRKTDNIEIHVTIGRPNYVEREFIKLCKRANESFPIKRVIVKLRTDLKGF